MRHEQVQLDALCQPGLLAGLAEPGGRSARGESACRADSGQRQGQEPDSLGPDTLLPGPMVLTMLFGFKEVLRTVQNTIF